ncbi:dihydroxyacetone kinase family protein [Oryzobacter sp. R7]|uniref:dihydroxyacetone kinase family protein n=1 Tax=Oryzobacter faecalis TaxID=3388656 RepID=UPI00398CB80B
MTFLLNDPADFPTQLADGFIAANRRYVRKVFGGAVRATKSRPGKVALVVGGGTGHYPAFAGWVGQGMADGVVFGNIFSSPSAGQAVSVGRAADQGGGVLIAFGNYAGDVLHFGQAAETLKAEGINSAIAVVTDDIASAPAEEAHKRRGICGWVTVFKVTGAACEEGRSFDEVVEVFNHVNRRTRTFGVAFSGCTLPGADGPLFTVPTGKMGVGLGVHGEPGIYDADLGTADEVARVLVEGLLKDRPDDAGDRVIALLNGLGSTTYEELFVTYGAVERLLADHGVTVVDCEVGELTTSMDMGGVSLSLTWTDEEIERLWNAPCDTPAIRRGAVGEVELVDDGELSVEAPELVVKEEGSPESRAVAQHLVDGLEAVLASLREQQEELGRLDAFAGDGDHGVGMVRGAENGHAAARELAERGGGAQTVLAGAGSRWSEQAGGTSGALWGAVLAAAGSALGDVEGVGPEAHARAARAGLDALQRIGGAQPGDKTMLDAFIPAVETLEAEFGAGRSPAQAWRAAAEAAEAAAWATAPLRPRIGRARPLAERSVGHPDAGAVSFALIVRTIADRMS